MGTVEVVVVAVIVVFCVTKARNKVGERMPAIA
jgi:hypothetical protein